MSASRKIAVIHSISDVPSRVPADKYGLWGLVASNLVQAQETPYALDELAALLEVTSELRDTEVTEYERLLIQLLVGVDNPSLREQIVEAFSDKYDTPIDWAFKKFNDMSLFYLAAETPNLGLMRWLLEKADYPVKAVEINLAFTSAVRAGYWEMVHYLIENHSMTMGKREFTTGLLEAAKQGNLSAMQAILKVSDLSHHVKRRALSTATEAGSAKCVAYLLAHPLSDLKPSQMVKGMNDALLKGHLGIAQLYASTATSRSIQRELERVFVEAVRKRDIERVQYISQLKVNGPSQAAIESGFERAAKDGSALIFSFLLSVSLPRQRTVDSALLLAAKGAHLEIVKLLCETEGLRPSHASLVKALAIAAKQGDIHLVDYLCQLDGLTFTRKNVDSAVKEASKQGHAYIVDRLCAHSVKPSKHIVTKARKSFISISSSETSDLLAHSLLKPIKLSGLDVGQQSLSRVSSFSHLAGLSLFNKTLREEGALRRCKSIDQISLSEKGQLI